MHTFSTMIPLRQRSYFSLLHGTASPQTLATQAAKLGYTHVALTDRDNLYGLPAFIRACNAAAIQPVLGAEVSCPQTDTFPLTCIIADTTGYSSLCRLLTRRHCDPTFSLSDIAAHEGDGLLFLANSPQLLIQLKNHGLPVIGDLGNKPTQQARALYTLCKRKNISAIYTPDASLARTGEEELHTLLHAISSNTSLSRVQLATAPQPLYPPEIYEQRFSIWPDVVKATNTIKEQITDYIPDFSIIMPPWDTKKTTLSAARQLRAEAYAGARNRYGDDLSEAAVERLEHELAIIEQMGFSSYFLIVQDIVHPKNNEGERVLRRICGRGSGAASLVAYCLQITNVCPLQHNLYFERFLNPGRTDPPDIDIDFAWDERDEVLDEVLTRFKGRAAMVCNHVCFKPRMAIRETAKAFGLPGYEISRITKKLNWLHTRTDNLEQTIRTSPALKGQELAPPWPQIASLAQQLIGLPRYLSVHPGGIIITPDRIDNHVPVEMAAKGVPVIQWEKDGAEDAGLVKIDILGNRSLGVIRDAIANVQRNGQHFCEKDWDPENDPRTRKAISQGRTMGCFYIESPAMRLLQQKAGSGEFDQLVLQSSIIRPAANDFVREYVRRLHGGSWQPLHPLLQDVLDDTFGLMVYQEDVSRVAVHLAGFSHAHGDGLRKILSKKDRELRLRDYKDRFYTGCKSNGLCQDTINQLWTMMMSFDGYSFCKPHSASYAKVSFQAAYLKEHYPAEFMAAVISNQGGFYSTFGYVSEARRLGLTILPPDVNRSLVQWQGKEKTLQTGLLAVHGLSRETAQRLLKKRKNQLFCSTADFLHRVNPAEDEARSLIHAGALDSLDHTTDRAQLLWELSCYKNLHGHGINQSHLFPPTLPPAPHLPQQPVRTRLRYEYSTLGFLTSCHPITLIRKQSPAMVKASAIPSHIGEHITFCGWLLTGKIVSTKTGDAMEFLTFEDETATVETTFFPAVYRRYAHLIRAHRGYILTGHVDEDFGAITLTVHELKIA
jgi:DNA polymerase-3 subunit alpha/error-prone DNA polymerase